MLIFLKDKLSFKSLDYDGLKQKIESSHIIFSVWVPRRWEYVRWIVLCKCEELLFEI